MGIETRSAFFDQMERELLAKTRLTQTVRYLDLYVSAFDHIAHHVRDPAVHRAELVEIDA